jgi:ATP-dependent DNA ligase
LWVIARKCGKRVKLYSRPGNDLTKRFALIVDARARSCIIDGETVACGTDGIACFELILDKTLERAWNDSRRQSSHSKSRAVQTFHTRSSIRQQRDGRD